MSYIGNNTQNVNYIPAVDFFSGNASTTVFTLSRPVSSFASIQVTIANVPQNPGEAYTVSGNIITFTSAPPNGTNNIYVYYTSPNTQVVQPGQGTVSPSSLSAGAPYWNTSGNVGIGTSSPSEKLHVSTGAASAFGRFQGSTGNLYVGVNSSNDGELNISTNNNLVFKTFGTERMRIDTSGNVGIGTSSPLSGGGILTAQLGMVIKGDGAYLGGQTYYDGNWKNAVSSQGGWALRNTSGVFTLWTGPSPGAAGSVFTTFAERMRIDSSGNLLVGTTSYSFSTTNYGIGFQPNGETFWIANTPSNLIAFNRNSDGNVFKFFRSGTQVGNVNVTTTATAYVTSSDYRLKENIQPMQNALGVVTQLNPVTYNWKTDGSAGQGFIAHELQAVVPDCVTGEKDAIDEEGNPKYQGIDTSFLVATLTKAIQELSAKSDALEARLAALEAK